MYDRRYVGFMVKQYFVIVAGNTNCIKSTVILIISVSTTFKILGDRKIEIVLFLKHKSKRAHYIKLTFFYVEREW